MFGDDCALRYDNLITTSYYKRLRKNFSQVLNGLEFVKDHNRFSILLIEARLNNINELKEQGYKPTEIFQLLRSSVTTLFNMKPVSISDFIFTNEYDLFQSIEVLQGFCHSDFLINDVTKFRELIMKHYDEYQARSLIK